MNKLEAKGANQRQADETKAEQQYQAEKENAGTEKETFVNKFWTKIHN